MLSFNLYLNGLEVPRYMAVGLPKCSITYFILARKLMVNLNEYIQASILGKCHLNLNNIPINPSHQIKPCCFTQYIKQLGD